MTSALALISNHDLLHKRRSSHGEKEGLEHGQRTGRLPFVELFQEEKPAVLAMKTRKRRVRQRIEGAVVSPAPEARESGCVPPWPDLRVWQ